MEYVTPLVPCATEVIPVMVPGCGMVELSVIDLVLGVPAPIQALLAVTLILPFVAPQEKSTVIVLVPCPVIVAPVPEYAHVYIVAPLTNAIEYGVDVWPFNGVGVPVIAPGVARVPVIVIPSILFELGVLQALLAFTVILPLVAPQAKSTIIELVPCPEVIFAPAGTVHV